MNVVNAPALIYTKIMVDIKGTTFGFIGRSGCGKGTQIKLFEAFLKEQGYDVVCIGLGAFGREFAQKDTLIGRWIKTIIEKGKQYPSWFASSLMIQAIYIFLNQTDQILLLDGSPRRLAEARILEELMKEIGRSPVQPIHLDISESEARKRLMSRGRTDDTSEAIEMRLSWFTAEVMPVIAYYDKRVITINSEQSIEAVQKEIQQKLAR